MYVLVVGAGKVGYHLTRELLSEGYEVLVLERDPRVCRDLSEELGSIVMQGDGCEVATLTEAGTARADMVIATTSDDEDNLVVCQVAKFKFNVRRTMALIKDPKNEAIFAKLGIDETVSSTRVIMERIQSEMPSHPTLHLMDLKQHGLEVVDFNIPPDAACIGKRLRDIPLPPQSVISVIISNAKGAVVPTGDTQLEADDEVIAVTRSETEEQLRAVFTGH